jgi:hypothetical protein
MSSPCLFQCLDPTRGQPPAYWGGGKFSEIKTDSIQKAKENMKEHPKLVVDDFSSREQKDRLI